MDWLVASDSWWGRLILERGIAAVYVVAFSARPCSSAACWARGA